MVIKIIPKREIKALKIEDVLFDLSLFFLIFALISFFFLDFFQKKNLEELEKINQVLTKEKTREEIRLEKKVMEAKEKIESFSKLLSSHKRTDQFFKFLENNTHPKVLFNFLTLRPEEGEVEISGKAESFLALRQQLLIFRKNEFVKDSQLKDYKIGKEGGISFSIDLSLESEIFK